ncbi:ABC transporter substrate-binding protein [Corynebacterium marinum]|uniref:ABC superfamily ATP binding cassette transporter, binding protein n=1 Tax=Corynebacterium marinum DSM 44953 TaxID=1224162 RepID=A0A0B6TT80_9CORY|nr:ABC transporter substrate-binding protein [Corynebacterium marinum]AJK69449.1 ABC superfamily ATP binding cassette transporter, binding protein [Corynebacterium marinum DSM 44953]GGO21564.1 peptide ABC transporter substrate-binding protein [Corynebacterium marinum]
MFLRRRWPATLLTVLAAITLTACSAGSTATQVGRVAGQNSVVVGATGVPASLDFTTTGGAAIPQALMGNIYEGLVRIDAAGDIVPLLATSWEVSGDATEYTFRLREGVTFSDGSPFNAESAKFSIGYVQESWSNGLKAQMDVVESVEVLDEYTLKVVLEHPSQRWLWSMGTLTGAMMSPTGVDKLATTPVGTGPYELRRFSVGESVSFSVRGDYWGDPANQNAAIRYFSDATSAVNALRSGDIDVVWAMQAPELLDTLPGDYDVKVGTTNGEVLVSMNNNRAPFDDPRVRRAVAHAVDRRAANQVVWEGLAADTGGAPVPPTDPWFTGEDFAPFDPGLARELLADAGFGPDNRPEITVSVPSLPYAQNISELVYSQLRDVGFDVRLNTVEFPAVWLAEVMSAKNYDMSIIAHVEARDIPALFGNPGYYLGYDNQSVRDDLLAADTAATAAEQSEHMEQAVATIMSEAGALTVFNLPNIVVTAPGVTGVNPTVVTDALELAGMEKQ